MLAKIIGGKIICPKCLARLADLKEAGTGTKIEFKCKARKNGETCNQISEIQL
jgi:hypothetical protein